MHELTRKQETFIAALLTLPTVDGAATAAKVSRQTAYEWLKLPHVQDAYAQARHEAFDSALQSLMSLTEDAITTLKKMMKDDEAPHAVRVRAAQIVLDKAIEVYKNEALEERLYALEEALKDKGA